jgi:hypothetical protein
MNRASEQVSVGVNSDLQYARTLINGGGVLSDEMGLGKTVRCAVSLCLLKAYRLMATNRRYLQHAGIDTVTQAQTPPNKR